MKHLAPALIVSLVVMTACGDGVTVGPTSTSSPDRAGSATPTPEVPAQPAYTVTGHVTDLRGDPVAGAEICDDGSTQTGLIFLELSSSNPSILLTESNGWITGIAPGTATITARYYGATATRLIRVDAAG